MTTYTATFRTETHFAVESIEADSAEEALRLAQERIKNDSFGLDWETYGSFGMPLDEIEIDGSTEGDRVLWQSPEFALRCAAGDLLDALCQADQALHSAPRFRVPGLDIDSYAIAANCDRAIAKAKGDTV